VSTIARWWKFNLVGAVGRVLQLAVLATLTWWMPDHYLFASAPAVELTRIHNFVLHLHDTWRDRNHSAIAAGLLWFHLSNGLVSLVENVAIMRLLLQEARLPVVAVCPETLAGTPQSLV
jgi:putative flippase GtrA